jgi:hypothetical protein
MSTTVVIQNKYLLKLPLRINYNNIRIRLSSIQFLAVPYITMMVGGISLLVKLNILPKYLKV